MISSFHHTLASIGKWLGLQKVAGIRTLYDAMLAAALPFPVRIQGSRMKPVSLRMYLQGAHEPGTTASIYFVSSKMPDMKYLT